MHANCPCTAFLCHQTKAIMCSAFKAGSKLKTPLLSSGMYILDVSHEVFGDIIGISCYTIHDCIRNASAEHVFITGHTLER